MAIAFSTGKSVCDNLGCWSLGRFDSECCSGMIGVELHIRVAFLLKASMMFGVPLHFFWT